MVLIMYPVILEILKDGLLAAVAAIGFSSISNTPRRAYLWCGLLAALGHALRYILISPHLLGMHIIAGSTAAAFVIGLLGVVFARKIHCPAEVCFFPALLPMIPGIYAYRTVEALVACLVYTGEAVFNHYLYLLAYNGFTCTFIIAGMVIGANIPVFVLNKLSFQATRA
ncbi:MAG: threonine/serine exporter family protein [Duncaniella sp.]|nr:threonine/serine exporter family protein [Duncaniella sp.]MDE6178248.1 threonine/serine exporter family protein [Duncaniella sp.]MDE6391406.1 threonine/serine exporter family protein [Duncaniella sp.]